MNEILIVDDDSSARAMLGLSLRQSGFSVETAAGGEEALGMLKNRRYDWLITDGKMQPIDGFELAEQAKRLQPDLRIVMISAVYAERDAGDRPIEHFFSKPVPVDDLVKCLSSRNGSNSRASA